MEICFVKYCALRQVVAMIAFAKEANATCVTGMKNKVVSVQCAKQTLYLVIIALVVLANNVISLGIVNKHQTPSRAVLKEIGDG